MAQQEGTPVAQNVQHAHGEWWKMLLGGAILFIIVTVVLLATGNPNLYPTVILLGNFLVPVVFVLFLYEHQHISSLTSMIVTRSFIFGGILGVLGASILEPVLIQPSANPDQGLTIGGAFLVAFIEEGVKLLAVVILARHLRHNSEMDGLLLGAAVGMGFAALESTGYAFTALIASRGDIVSSLIETVVRGLLAPFGHGAWTAFVSGMLFRKSTPEHFRITGAVILAFLFVVIVHGLWDGLPRTIFLVVPPGFSVSLVSLVLSILSILALVLIYRQAEHQRAQ